MCWGVCDEDTGGLVEVVSQRVWGGDSYDLVVYGTWCTPGHMVSAPQTGRLAPAGTCLRRGGETP